MKRFVFILITCLISNLSVAQAPDEPPKIVSPTSAENGFTLGLQFMQEKKFDLAEQVLLKSLEFDPLNKYLLFNLGLSAAENSHPGLAIGAWRRAIFVDPGMQEAHRGLKHIYKQLPSAKQTSSTFILGSLKSDFLDHLNVDVLAVIAAALATLAGLTLIRYFALRKKAFDRDLELPTFTAKSYSYMALFLLSCTLFALKVYSTSFKLATVINPTQIVFTVPNSEASTLFELMEGQQVLIHKTNNDWSFIKYPGGLSGWVPSTSIFQHSGRSFK